jgi:hypothetical protein
MKLRHLPAALRHDPGYVLRNAPRMAAHTLDDAAGKLLEGGSRGGARRGGCRVRQRYGTKPEGYGYIGPESGRSFQDRRVSLAPGPTHAYLADVLQPVTAMKRDPPQSAGSPSPAADSSGQVQHVGPALDETPPPDFEAYLEVRDRGLRATRRRLQERRKRG